MVGIPRRCAAVSILGSQIARGVIETAAWGAKGISESSCTQSALHQGMCGGQGTYMFHRTAIAHRTHCALLFAVVAHVTKRNSVLISVRSYVQPHRVPNRRDSRCPRRESSGCDGACRARLVL